MKRAITVPVVNDKLVPEGARYIGLGGFDFLSIGDTLEGTYSGKFYPHAARWTVIRKIEDGRIQVRSDTGLLMTWEKITPAYYQDYVLA